MTAIRRVLLLQLSVVVLVLLSACGTSDIVVVNDPTQVATVAQEEVPSPVLQAGDTEVLPSSPDPAAPAIVEPVMEVSGTEVQEEAGAVVGPSEEGAPTDSTSRIAVMGPYGNGGALYPFVMNADGSGLQPVGAALAEGYFPTLSPDGSRVAYMSIVPETGDPDIFVVDVQGGEPVNLTNKAGFDTQPVWSPDGEQLAFVTDRDGGDVDIWVMDADGGNAQRLMRTPGKDELGSWSPDGSKIVYSNQSELGVSLWTVEVESGETTQLTQNESGGSDSAPAWSPDGERIAFFSTDGPNSMPNIYTIGAGGEGREQVTDGQGPEVFPLWSPDGSRLLYTAVTGDQQFQLVSMDLETKEISSIPDVLGFGTSWSRATTPLEDTGFAQGPKNTGVEVDPAVLEVAYRKGSPDAPVTIIEFSDYQCPFCRRWVTETMPQLEPYIEDGTVQLLFVDFPLNIHAQAPAAAEAARCAGEIAGEDGYWTMHDALFAGLDRWGGQTQPVPLFNEIATEVGLDGAAIQACVESGRYSDEVQLGLQEGLRLGVTGTPTFFINGNRLVGAQPFEAFQQYLP